MESPIAMPGSPSPLDQDEAVFPCKGCGEILEEGKAFELAGNRWHIDCFRCNSCNTLLDSDANLLLLGDGSLICNNCTYSCTACGNKIEDLAILTGDQAFCANCFKCRNCKRKIENLRYARTSQGIFCMQCHESLMARRRKKTRAAAPARTTSANSNGTTTDKSLPALPANLMDEGGRSADSNGPSETFETLPAEALPATREAQNGESRIPVIAANGRLTTRLLDNQYLQSRSYGDDMSSQAELASPTSDDFFIPVGLDPSPAGQPPVVAKPQQPTSSAPYLDNFHELVSGTSRSASRERNTSRSRTSPHIAHQEKLPESSRRRRDSPGSANTMSSGLASPTGGMMDRPRFSPSNELEDPLQRDRFKLQEAPKGRSSASKTSSTRNSPNPNLSNLTTGSPVAEAGAFAGASGIERTPSPDAAQRSKVNATTKPSPLSSPATNNTQFERPVRSDSMPKTQPKQPAVTRKEVPRPDDASRGIEQPATSGGKQESAKGKPISKPTALSNSLAMDSVPVRSSRRPITGEKEDDVAPDFVANRAPPLPPPPGQGHMANESITSIQSDQLQMRDPSSPGPYYGDGSVEDDVARGLGSEDADQPSIFRKMSKAVRHGRSQSDKIGSASPKWARTSRGASIDISSPIMAPADPKDEVVELRNKLRYSSQRVAELEADKAALEEKVNGTVDIRQVNTELREKRSTMAVLDTQREMVVRELEVMTEQLQNVKSETGPLDIDQLRTDIMREFAASLGKLKDSLGGQIEDLITKKNELTNEISTLIQMKDKGFQEYESLSTRNQQLTEVNNQLVHQIQDLYKQGKHPGASNGLGIYSTYLDNKAGSITNESQLSGDTEVMEPATILSGPQVVNIRKGQPKKFNWKKGSQSVAKNVTKGFRGAFSSNQGTATLREEQFEEGVPYTSMSTGEAPTTGALPMAPSRLGSDQGRQAWAFLNQKDKSGATTGLTGSNGISRDAGASSTSLTPDASTNLFGSDLTARCEFEKSVVPSLVMSCISEVALRGLHVEGIYRKSGSSSQVKTIQQNFEKDYQGCSVSDPDLDIHAVTGTLKQYLRRLPNPLITFECYDAFLEASTLEGNNEAMSARVRDVILSLPKSHRDTLEYLMYHLYQVMECSADNLMSALNIAVVFAPTIMRPQSIEREMTDMQAQREAVQCLLENHEFIFGTLDVE